MKQVDDICEEYLKNGNEEEAGDGIKNLKIPDRYISDMLTTILNKAMDRNGKLLRSLYSCDEK